MNKKDILKNVTREQRLINYNDYLLKCGAITKRQHLKIYVLILQRTSTSQR